MVAVLSGSIFLLLGAGGVLLLPFYTFYGSRVDESERWNGFQIFYCLFCSGTLIHYALILILDRLGLVWSCFIWLSFFGWIAIGYFYFKNNLWRLPSFAVVTSFFLVAFITFLIFLKTLSEPINTWDARAIWFFHAKIIYFAGGLVEEAGWENPSISFSHVDYPKLLAGLSAQFVHYFGKWNEFLPKLGLIPLFFGFALAIASLVRKRWSFFYFLVFGFCLQGQFFWNGYMDGYLALFVGVAAIYAGIWMRTNSPLDFLAAMLSLGIVSGLKQEGAVIAGCVLIGIIGMKMWNKRVSNFVFWDKDFWIKTFILISCFIPWAIWEFLRRSWGLETELGLGIDLIDRLISRVFEDNKIPTIFLWLFFRGNLGESFGVLAVAGFGLYHLRVKPNLSFGIAIIAGILYTLVLAIVYLCTPRDLEWHLLSSVDRACLTIRMLFICSTYWLLDSLESSK